MRYLLINTDIGYDKDNNPVSALSHKCVRTQRLISPDPGSVVTNSRGREYTVTKRGQLRRLDRLATAGR